MSPLPKAPAEVPRVSALEDLAPGFRVKLEAVLDGMRAASYDPIVFETLRTDERQRFIYGFGREYDDGRGIVTHSSDADETWHGFGLAADVISRSKLWNAPPEFWTVLGRECRAQGLTWGGDWNGNELADETFVDRPQVQCGPPMRRSPSPKAARLQAEGGNAAVWAEVGAA